jgi:hypothetical protein
MHGLRLPRYVTNAATELSNTCKDPKNGLKDVMKWPTYDADKPTLIALGGRESSKVDFIEHTAAAAGGC